MLIKPLIYLQHITDDEIAQYDCSDKIWLGRSTYERWVTSSEPGIVNIVQLTNGVDQTVVGSIYSVHQDDEDVIYVPDWMYKMLDYDAEHITLTRYEASLCTGLTILPHTSDHIHAPDPQELLRDAFEQYSCLTPGQTLQLWITFPEPHAFTVTITQLAPRDTTLCIRNCEVELELLPPLDLPIPPPISAPLSEETIPIEDTKVCTNVLGGEIHTDKTARDLMREAALRRILK